MFFHKYLRPHRMKKKFNHKALILKGIWDKTPPKKNSILLLLQKGVLGQFNLIEKKWIWQVSLSSELTIDNISMLAETTDDIWVNIDNQLMCFQKADGVLKTEYTFDEINIIIPSNQVNNVVVDIFNTTKQIFQTIYINEQTQEWGIDANDYTTFMICNNEIVFRVEANKKLIALNKGKVLWTQVINGTYQFFDGTHRSYKVLKLLIHQNLLIIGFEGFKIKALDITSGKEVWCKILEMDFIQNIALFDNLIYMLDFEHYYILNVLDGSIKYHVNIREAMKAHQGMMIGELCVTERYIFCGTFASRGRLLCLEKETGQILDSIEIGEKIPLNSAIHVLNNMVLFTDVKGSLHQVTFSD